jgi:hypothetical protein
MIIIRLQSTTTVSYYRQALLNVSICSFFMIIEHQALMSYTARLYLVVLYCNNDSVQLLSNIIGTKFSTAFFIGRYSERKPRVLTCYEC